MPQFESKPYKDQFLGLVDKTLRDPGFESIADRILHEGWSGSDNGYQEKIIDISYFNNATAKLLSEATTADIRVACAGLIHSTYKEVWDYLRVLLENSTAPLQLRLMSAVALKQAGYLDEMVLGAAASTFTEMATSIKDAANLAEEEELEQRERLAATSLGIVFSANKLDEYYDLIRLSFQVGWQTGEIERVFGGLFEKASSPENDLGMARAPESIPPADQADASTNSPVHRREKTKSIMNAVFGKGPLEPHGLRSIFPSEFEVLDKLLPESDPLSAVLRPYSDHIYGLEALLEQGKVGLSGSSKWSSAAWGTPELTAATENFAEIIELAIYQKMLTYAADEVERRRVDALHPTFNIPALLECVERRICAPQDAARAVVVPEAYHNYVMELELLRDYES